MGFKFGNNAVRLEIEGKIYRAVITRKTVEDMKAFAEKAKEMQLDIVGCTDAETENKVIDFIDNAIDKLISKGTAAEIFADRSRDGFERCEVFAYICSAIIEQCGRISAAKGI